MEPARLAIFATSETALRLIRARLASIRHVCQHGRLTPIPTYLQVTVQPSTVESTIPDLWHSARRMREESHRTDDRKSTRLNSSHSQISYAVFCLKKKKKKKNRNYRY